MAENDGGAGGQQQGGQQQQQNGGQQGGQQQQQAPWHQGVDGELIGHAQNKGWKLDDPKAAFAAAAQAHREAQSKLGVPAEQLLRVPKDAADEAGWKSVWTRLGVPEAAKDYDLSGIKFGDGADLEAGFVDTMRAALHGAHVPKDRAGEVVKAVVKYLGDADTAEAAETTAKLDEEKAALAKNWGANMAANKFIASQAAQKLGVTPQTVAALEKQVGYKAIMEMFHKIGTAMGEDKFVGGGDRPGGGIMSRDQAQARKSELMADASFRQRHLAGDAAARREMRALNVIISGDDGSSYAA